MSVSSPTVSGGPVEFDPYSTDFFDSPYETYRRMRDEAPVYYNDRYGFYALTRYDDVAQAIRDFETYSSTRGITLDMLKAEEVDVPPGYIIMMDPPEHERMRKLVNRVFTPRAVTALEPMVRETIDSFANRLDPASFDAVSDFSALFPVEIITTMLGVPAQDRQQLRLWLDAGLEREPGSMGPSQKGLDAIMKTFGYYYELIQQRRADPREDMISRLIEAEIIDDDGQVRRLDDVEIAAFANLLGGAGAETVTKLVGNALVVFADNPDQWRKLRDDRGKIPAAVEELLRYEGPTQYQVRTSTREVTLHGVTIPAGSAVLLINGSATRDERTFPDPDKFDIDRERKFAFNLSFGYGIHSCLGAALARMEGRIALDALLDLIPTYDIDRAGLRRVNMTNVCGWSSVPVRAATNDIDNEKDSMR